MIFRQHYSIRRAGYPTVESVYQLFFYTIHPILREVEHTITPLLSLPQIWGEFKQATSAPYLARTHDGPSWPKSYSWVAARFAWASPPCALSVKCALVDTWCVHSVSLQITVIVLVSVNSPERFYGQYFCHFFTETQHGKKWLEHSENLF